MVGGAVMIGSHLLVCVLWRWPRGQVGGGGVTMGAQALVCLLWNWPRGHAGGCVTGGGGVTQRLLARTWF
jgi:hypothetical protein